MTLTLHTEKQDRGRYRRFFIFGDDLEAILDALEEGEGVQEDFSAAVSNVSVENWTFDSNCRSNKLKNLHDVASF